MGRKTESGRVNRKNNTRYILLALDLLQYDGIISGSWYIQGPGCLRLPHVSDYSIGTMTFLSITFYGMHESTWNKSLPCMPGIDARHASFKISIMDMPGPVLLAFPQLISHYCVGTVLQAQSARVGTKKAVYTHIYIISGCK